MSHEIVCLFSQAFFPIFRSKDLIACVEKMSPVRWAETNDWLPNLSIEAVFFDVVREIFNIYLSFHFVYVVQSGWWIWGVWLLSGILTLLRKGEIHVQHILICRHSNADVSGGWLFVNTTGLVLPLNVILYISHHMTGLGAKGAVSILGSLFQMIVVLL